MKILISILSFLSLPLALNADELDDKLLLAGKFVDGNPSDPLNFIESKAVESLKDPQLREDMMDYTRGMCLVYQKSLDAAREHLKDPDTFKKVIEILQKNRHKK